MIEGCATPRRRARAGNGASGSISGPYPRPVAPFESPLTFTTSAGFFSLNLSRNPLVAPAVLARSIIDVARDSIVTLVLVASPLMLVGLAVGLAISLFQALTQIQEMTLVFVPKILAMFIAMLIALPFMGDALQGYMARIAAHITGG